MYINHCILTIIYEPLCINNEKLINKFQAVYINHYIINNIFNYGKLTIVF